MLSAGRALAVRQTNGRGVQHSSGGLVRQRAGGADRASGGPRRHRAVTG